MHGTVRTMMMMGLLLGAVGCEEAVVGEDLTAPAVTAPEAAPAAPAEAPAADAAVADAALGGLERVEIDAVIRERMDRISYCFQRGLARDRTLEGDLVVKFVIAADGSVSSAKAESTTLADQEVVDCILDEFGTLEFPEPPNGGIVIVSYPFVFTLG